VPAFGALLQLARRLRTAQQQHAEHGVLGHRQAECFVDDVAVRGDAALIEATRRFDRLDLDASGLRITAAEIDAALLVLWLHALINALPDNG